MSGCNIIQRTMKGYGWPFRIAFRGFGHIPAEHNLFSNKSFKEKPQNLIRVKLNKFIALFSIQ